MTTDTTHHLTDRHLIVLDSGRIGRNESIRAVLGEQPAALGTVTVLDTLSTAADPVLAGGPRLTSGP
ncbi:hypothetical protein ACFQ0T_17900 [Kitasatospora gansuensis]